MFFKLKKKMKIEKKDKDKVKKQKKRYILGIDEVGRGALAGPVTLGAVLILENQKNWPQYLGVLKDSKKLSPLKREKWFLYLKKEKIFYAVYHVSFKKIDKINIFNATNFGVLKVFLKIIKKSNFQDFKNLKIYLDGGLFLKTNLVKKNNIKTIIKGDEKIDAIKLASIVAKVSRDKKMMKLSQKYPVYNFKKNKGYGTKEHILKIKKYGISKIHRLTFLKNYFKI